MSNINEKLSSALSIVQVAKNKIQKNEEPGILQTIREEIIEEIKEFFEDDPPPPPSIQITNPQAPVNITIIKTDEGPVTTTLTNTGNPDDPPGDPDYPDPGNPNDPTPGDPDYPDPVDPNYPDPDEDDEPAPPRVEDPNYPDPDEDDEPAPPRVEDPDLSPGSNPPPGVVAPEPDPDEDEEEIDPNRTGPY